jgi:hypothetical protein
MKPRDFVRTGKCNWRAVLRYVTTRISSAGSTLLLCAGAQLRCVVIVQSAQHLFCLLPERAKFDPCACTCISVTAGMCETEILRRQEKRARLIRIFAVCLKLWTITVQLRARCAAFPRHAVQNYMGVWILTTRRIVCCWQFLITGSRFRSLSNRDAPTPGRSGIWRQGAGNGPCLRLPTV